MPERDYSHRSTIDKLGIKPGHRVAFDERAGPIDPALVQDVLDRVARPAADTLSNLDIVLAAVDDTSDPITVLREWRDRISPTGAIWLLTPKRGQPGYVNQTDLIPAGAVARLVDNKTCSVSDTVSGMRFVIRRADRPSAGKGKA
jgi:hypothetical protein